MKIPESVRRCIDRLEERGFPCYTVGGCVRDWLMCRPCADYDLCTAATPEEIKSVFAEEGMVLAGEKHGTVGIITPDGVVEITTFRTEGGYDDNRHPSWVQFVPNIEDDLSRRDFTVNAMAYSPTRGLQDPYGGENDLKNGILRCVGDPQARFREDSLRILRGVRFAIRFRLKVEENTMAAMVSMVGLMDNLARERVFAELSKLLPLATAEDLIHFAPILTQSMPTLAATVGFDQKSPHHAYDVYTHTAYVTAAVPAKDALRWAALLHDIGKVPTFRPDENGRGHFKGHAEESAQLADAILQNLKAPNALRQETTELIRLHMSALPEEKKTLRRWLARYGRPFLEDLFALQEADMVSKGVDEPRDTAQFDRLRRLLDALEEENSCLKVTDLVIGGKDLMALGFYGKDIGTTLNRLLDQVMDEMLANEKNALLAAARDFYKEKKT